MTIKYVVQFQYKPPHQQRPLDEILHEEPFTPDQGAFMPLPTPGDSVEIAGQNYKVLTRHFSYLEGVCVINIVLSDIAEEEMSARLKM